MSESDPSAPKTDAPPEPAFPVIPGLNDPATLERAGAFWLDQLNLWQRMLAPADADEAKPDKRFAAPEWRENPWYDWVRRSYLTLSDHLLRGVDAMEGVSEAQKERMRFAARGFIEAMSPSNFPLTNPQVMKRAVETKGESLVTGMKHLLSDLERGQLTHTQGDAFEVGRNLATTPGKVIKRTPLFELIHYTPTTDQVAAIPLVIFPPWINRFYILDLTPEKSFIRWAVEQGLSVFMVSWKSADATMKDVVWDDYVKAQIEAIDTVRETLSVEKVHAIGYCVAGTTLAATLALLAARGQADKVASATFFTAQVDFSGAGELKHFVDDDQLAMIEALAPDGYLDGRYMATTFNLLRGRDLIWNYVSSNYLLGEDYMPFDLLHWNSDVTNLPAKWHASYLADLYRDNLLAQAGALSIGATPVDLSKVVTPAYIQAGREDHIAPARSVWKITEHFAGPLRFVLAGSGHIAGVVNPPSAQKYQYWTNDGAAATLEEFVAGATETKGSWWPDWMSWIEGFGEPRTAAKGARIPKPKEGLGDAPGSYVKTR